MNSIIIVDDDQDFIKDFTNQAFAKGITVAPANSLEGLQKLLPQYVHRYAAVVLDIKCLLKDDQAKEDSSFIGSALTYLNSTTPGFPRFILTGDESEFDSLKRYHADENMFIKKPDDQERLLYELLYCIQNADLLKIKREYNVVFDIFESGKMNDLAEQMLLKILKEGLIEKNFRNFKGVLADVRSFQETIYKSINIRNKAVVPDNMFRPNGMIKFNELMKHLSGGVTPPTMPLRPVYQVPTVFYLSNTLYWSSGEYIHEDPNRSYFISEFTIKSLINNLLELIIWSNQY
ncbi:DNA-binding transcriptional response regulator [Sphingobacterium endophyticum]|uniref:hypothetical protein n=1 Tax=Sphingobacterium endophyticum TaxID=2546448 RepID=UPI0012E22244|nr:hypothetical protein [Sphingobacterium endophyticum]